MISSTIFNFILRFCQGSPLALTLRDERSSIRVVLSKINNFDHKTKKQSDGCPLTPHTRQNAPRTLDPMISKAYLDAAVIIRAGILYGDDVSMPYASLTKWHSR